MCGGVFDVVETEEWNSEKALEEYRIRFPEAQSIPDEQMIVCDDCYKMAMEFRKQDDLNN